MAHPNSKIDESLAVRHWATNFPQEDSAKNFFEKYAKANNSDPLAKNIPDTFEHQHIHYNTEESQVKGLDVAFKQLKNNQIDKLNSFKVEY